MIREPPPQDWRAYLLALPESDAPEALWTRIAQARAEAAAPLAAKRSRLWPAAGLAAVVALAAVFAVQRPVRVSEAPVASVPAAPAAESPALRALDDAIALAYARNAGQDELDSLWQTRERLLGSPADSEPLLARL